MENKDSIKRYIQDLVTTTLDDISKPNDIYYIRDLKNQLEKYISSIKSEKKMAEGLEYLWQTADKIEAEGIAEGPEDLDDIGIETPEEEVKE